MNNYEQLFFDWCEALHNHQIPNGGIWCPACEMIHGRCMDAIYPFLCMADRYGKLEYVESAKLLFDWAECNVSQEDGSYYNDIDSDWKGITVFTVIQLIESLEQHGHLLDQETYHKWKLRVKKAAEFLYEFSVFDVCNINYKTANCLAMELCGRFFNEEKYHRKSKSIVPEIEKHFSEDNLYFGEGRPIDGYSERGCRSIDIGYNLEESLPVIVLYAKLTKNEILLEKVKKAMYKHLEFILEDGGIDNSFGSRNYKWSYWGSRTTDGCMFGLLLLAEYDDVFGVAAKKQLGLLMSCTQNGLLGGGLHYELLSENFCVHHTFSHAKVMADILNRGFDTLEFSEMKELPRQKLRGTKYFPDIDTWQMGNGEFTATITAYDWEYMKLKGGHASGGTLTFLWHKKVGPILSASMSEYTRKEKNNMQIPKYQNHECLTPRIEFMKEDTIYSSIYDVKCELYQEESNSTIISKGILSDVNNRRIEDVSGVYGFQYQLSEEFFFDIYLPPKAVFILPIVALPDEIIAVDENQIVVQRQNKWIQFHILEGIIEKETSFMPIYNLTPGLSAVKIVLRSEKEHIKIGIKVEVEDGDYSRN